MITRVYIDNFRCFANCEVWPRRVNLLIGKNGSGKSSFMEALHSVIELAILGEAVETTFPSSTVTRWNRTPTQRFEIDLAGNTGSYHYALELSHNLDQESVVVERESVKHDSRTIFLFENGVVHLYKNDGAFGAQFPFRGSRSFLPQLEARPENTLLTWFLNCLRKIWLLKLDPSAVQSESRAESDSLHSDGSNFASWYRHLSQERTEELPVLFRRIGQTLPGFRSLKAVSTGKGGQRRELVVAFGFGKPEIKYEIDFDEISDGERAIIILYSILTDVESTPKTLLLDEPENFVGLQLIQPWLVELADAMQDKAQLFLVSHHPEVIDYLAADYPLLFERPDGGPTRVRAEPFDRNEGLKASELVTRGLLDD